MQTINNNNNNNNNQNKDEKCFYIFNKLTYQFPSTTLNKIHEFVAQMQTSRVDVLSAIGGEVVYHIGKEWLIYVDTNTNTYWFNHDPFFKLMREKASYTQLMMLSELMGNDAIVFNIKPFSKGVIIGHRLNEVFKRSLNVPVFSGFKFELTHRFDKVSV